MSTTQTTAEHEKQIHEAEELLFTGAQKQGVAKSLFLGRFVADWVMPYPQIADEQRGTLEESLAKLREFLDEKHDPVAIDRNADIPREVIDGLGKLGVLGMTAPPEFGGRGFGQQQYCKVMEVIGGHCSSTAVFVNAHHSIGIRALLLFGTKAQQEKWLPD